MCLAMKYVPWVTDVFFELNYFKAKSSMQHLEMSLLP